MRRPSRLILAAVGISLLVSACARGATTGPGDGGTSSPSSDPHQLVVRIDSCCGFVAREYTLRDIPSFSLLGDGRVFTLGPQIEIYPGPALPNVQVAQVSDEGVQRILAAARDAGLYESHDYMQPMRISDQPTTTFTLVEPEGTRHVTHVYALTETDTSGLSAADREARQRLRHFADQMGSLRNWLPQGSVGDDQSYRTHALRVYSRPFTQADQDAQPSQPSQDWPLSEPLATFGAPAPDQSGFRCGVVQGDDLKTLMPDVERSNELTPWRSGDSSYRLVFRPLLPDESGC